MTHPWTEAFVKWIESLGGRLYAAAKLRRSIGAVHAWIHGTIPRDKNLRHIAKVSKGAVPESLAKSAAAPEVAPVVESVSPSSAA